MVVPFSEISIGDALIRSRGEEKAIFAYFYSERTSEQESALSQLLSLNSIREWLESNTVPILINVDDSRVINIDSVPLVPWCSFLSPNLRQISEIYDISQINTEKRFITYADFIVNGEESLQHAKKRVTTRDTNNPKDWLILARVYSDWGYDKKAEKIIFDWLQRRVDHRHCLSYIQGAFMWGLCYDCFENSDRMKVNLSKRRNELHNQIIRPEFNNFGTLLEYVRLNRFLTEQNKSMDLYVKLCENKVNHLDTLKHLMEIEYERFYDKKMFTDLFSNIDLITMAEEAIVTYQEEKKWILESEKENKSGVSDIESLNMHLRKQLCMMYEILLRNDEIRLADEIANRLLTILPQAESYSFLASFGTNTGNSLFRDLGYAQRAYDLQPDHITYASSLHGICLKILEKKSLKATFREELKSIINNVERDFPSLAQMPTQSLRFEFGDKIFLLDFKKKDLDKEY